MATLSRKPTTNNIYLSWNNFERDTLNRGTLKTLVERRYIVCFTSEQKFVIVLSFSNHLETLSLKRNLTLSLYQKLIFIASCLIS